MFHLRFTLNSKAYQHRVTKAVEMMIQDAMEFAKDVTVEDDDGNPKMIHEAPNDMGAFIKLNDDVLHKIAVSSSNDAKTLVDRIYNRDLYTYLDETIIQDKTTEEDVMNEILEKCKEDEREAMKKCLAVDIAKFDYGDQDENPVYKAYFYTKTEKTKAVKLDKKVLDRQMLLPRKYNERIARVFCKSTEPELKSSLKDITREWISACNK